MFQVVVLASAGGGNFVSVVEHQKKYGYMVTKLIVDRECGATEKAERYGIPWERILRSEKETMSARLMDMIPSDTDLIVLCGWLSILERDFLEKWEHKVINVHPSLLPKYGGKGMYGVKVHEAVVANGEEETGCTVHYVNEEIDGGDIILQKKMNVDKTLTPWELGGQVFKLENLAVVEAIAEIMNQNK